MLNKGLETKNIKLARVRYFDTKVNGAIVDDNYAYAFLYKVGDQYINLFDLERMLPVFERSPFYSCSTIDGVDFGSKLNHLCGEVTEGPCYVLSVDKEVFFDTDQIGLDDLRECIFKSDRFFVNRYDMLQEASPIERFKYRKTIKSDLEQLERLREFFVSCHGGVQYKKED